MTLTNDWQMIQTSDGAYRYVNHVERLLTIGFSSEDGLTRNTDIIRMDPGTRELQRDRYDDNFKP